jgi:predicted 2-oxoglutarate/Fe(II)-dependent dioxygenase YbiX/peroxiredoxin
MSVDATIHPGYRLLGPGDPAPWFVQRAPGNPAYRFHTAAGRWIVLCFFASAAEPTSRAALALVEECAGLFDDRFARFYGVSLDKADEAARRVVERPPGVRFFWDFDGAISEAYGVVPVGPPPGRLEALRKWVILDPMLRVHRILPFAGPDGGRAAVAATLAALPPVARFAGTELPAPVLLLPQVFEPEFCARLIALYTQAGGVESGFMREENGRTVAVVDHGHKRRSDHLLVDPAAIEGARMRVRRRVVPEIRKAFQFEVTRMERFIVGCYDAETGGHFRPHRDNTTKGTAHRRFAVSIGLNDDYAGGDLVFPEYGPRSYRAAAGLALVFSCSLLHMVHPVTAGRRFVFLPFLYDDAAARQREANNAFLDPSIGAYHASTAKPA